MSKDNPHNKNGVFSGLWNDVILIWSFIEHVMINDDRGGKSRQYSTRHKKARDNKHDNWSVAGRRRKIIAGFLFVRLRSFGAIRQLCCSCLKYFWVCLLLHKHNHSKRNISVNNIGKKGKSQIRFYLLFTKNTPFTFYNYYRYLPKSKIRF